MIRAYIWFEQTNTHARRGPAPPLLSLDRTFQGLRGVAPSSERSKTPILMVRARTFHSLKSNWNWSAMYASSEQLISSFFD